MGRNLKYTLTGVIASAMMLQAAPAAASSHREAPAITKTPKIDGTDVYAFRSYEPGREDYVTIIANYQPIQAPYGGPNYFTMDPEAVYEIHIDNDGDAVEDITFVFDFDNELKNGTGITLDIGGVTNPIALRQAGQVTEALDQDLGEDEFYSLMMTTGDRRSQDMEDLIPLSGGRSFIKPLDNIGNKTLPDYESYVQQFIYTIDIPNCPFQGRVFAGQRAEAFAVNLGEIFDLVNLVPIEPPGSTYGNDDDGGFPGGIEQDRANDDLVGVANVTSLAIEVPIDCVTGAGNGVIGVWSTSSLPQAQLEDPNPTYEQSAVYGGAFVQQSRLGAPLVNELVIGLPDKNLFNAAEPTQDAALADYVTNPTFPALLDILFREAVNSTLGTNIENLAPSNLPREDLVATFLTGFPGVAGFETLTQQATVTPSEMIRLNTAVPPTPIDQQSMFGLIGGDLAGYPNGRRPGDDAVDITLRVAMGRLCYPVPIGDQTVQLPYCTPEDAPVGNVAFTDGAPISASELRNSFPYLNTPLRGSPNIQQGQ